MKKFLVLAVFLLTCSGQKLDQEAVKDIQAEAQVAYYEVQPLQVTPVNFEKGDMVRDIVKVWELFFEDGQAPAKDPRRESFVRLASEIADWIIYFQNHDTDLGDRLPKAKSVPIVVAYIVAKESSVQPLAIGYKYHEVGLFQLWGAALAGYPWEKVRDNTNLGAMLGIRWLAHSIGQCGLDVDNWIDEYWLKALTSYGAGFKAIDKGTCDVYSFARQRFTDINFYSMRVDMAKQKFSVQ